MARKLAKTCPHCGAGIPAVELADHEEGQEVKCPTCGGEFDPLAINAAERQKSGCLLTSMCLLTLGIGALGLGAAWLDHRLRHEADTMLGEVRMLVEEVQPRIDLEGPDSARIYRNAFMSFGVRPRQCTFFRSDLAGGDLAIGADDVKVFLAQNRIALGLLAKAAEQPGCLFIPDYTAPQRNRMPSFMAIRAAACLLMVDSRSAVHDGGYEAGAERIRQALHLARGTSRMGRVSGAMLAISVENLIVEDIRATLHESDLGSAYLLAGIRALGAHLEERPELADCLRVERCVGMLRAVEILAGRRGCSHSNRFGAGLMFQMNRISGAMLRDARTANEFWDRVERAAQLTEPGRFKALQRMARDSRLRERVNRMRAPFSYVIPGVVALARSDAEALARLRCARLALGCRLYRARFGGLPSKLADLTARLPRLFKVMPDDPFSGKPMLYRKTKSGFVVYSVGAYNPDDDGAPNLFGNTRQPDLTYAIDSQALAAHRATRRTLRTRRGRRRYRPRRPVRPIAAVNR
jgi:hypothetical protein